MKCDCATWMREQPIPNKIIIFKCTHCETNYTLFPDGTIEFEATEVVGERVAAPPKETK